MAAVAESAPPGGERLPQLRAELQILNDSQGDDGAVLFDPLRMRYFRIDRVAAELLSQWTFHATAADIARAVDERFGTLVTLDEIEAVSAFLSSNQMVVPAAERDWRRLLAIARRGRQGWLGFAVHNYLFAKVPLVRPQKALERLAPLFEPLYTRSAAVLVALVGLAGLYLVSRQWDAFLATFSDVMSLEGAASYLVAIILVKSLHELGHAITAARFGCRVPSMGVCFMVMVPMLYTDVTDAWRLRSARQRLAIDSAGVVVEIALACIATLLWAFLPDGIARGLAFATATTGWLVSLGMNLNPFMRFDGYYILADITGIENLQPRAFAIGRWRLREILFGIGDPAPERLSRRTTRWLAIYAVAVWLYRIVLFTGIALLVYHMSFKLLGIALFAIEIVFFIALPIWREVREWFLMRKRIVASPRALATFAVLSTIVGAAFVPWSTSVSVPAVLEAGEVMQAFPKRAAHVVTAKIENGREVARGEVMAELVSPELEHELRLTRAKMRLVEGRLGRRAADRQERSETLVLEDMLASLRARSAGIEEQRKELRIAADIAGTIAEADPHLHPGRWLQRGDLIAVVRSKGPDVVRGYVSEDSVARIDLAAPAYFVPGDPLGQRLTVALDRLSPVGTGAMDLIELSSHYGGGVASRVRTVGEQSARQAEHIPVAGQFMLVGHLDDVGALPSQRVVRGTLHAGGRGESFAARAWRQVLKVLVRESGV